MTTTQNLALIRYLNARLHTYNQCFVFGDSVIIYNIKQKPFSMKLETINGICAIVGETGATVPAFITVAGDGAIWQIVFDKKSCLSQLYLQKLCKQKIDEWLN